MMVEKQEGGMDENSMSQKLGAEVLGTAVLVFLGAGSVPALFLARGGKGGAPFTGAELLTISTAFGFAVVAMVYAIGKVSGCHINPAVTLSMAFTRRMPWGQAIPYVIAQCAGAVIGGLAIWGVFAHKVHDAGVGHIAYGPDTATGSALLNEGIGTAILLFTILGIVDKRGGADLLAGIVIGLIVIGIIITVAPQTGAAINPARYTGTLITAQLAGLNPDWGQAWVYWVADVVGGLCGVLAYDLLAKPRLAARALRGTKPAAADVAESAA
jgi:glycerol uptake facilitator protein